MKTTKVLLGLILVFLISISCIKPSTDFSQLKDGDIIFQTSNSGQSKAIQLATHSIFSHVGIIYKKGNELMVLEAVQPVNLTPIQEWISRGDNQYYLVKRLKNKALLTSETVQKMKTIGESYLGKNYDLYFEWTDEKMYCSELVWKIYQRGAGISLSPLKKMASFDLTSPIVKQIITERYGNKIPLNQSVVAPSDLANSELLETIMEK